MKKMSKVDKKVNLPASAGALRVRREAPARGEFERISILQIPIR